MTEKREVWWILIVIKNWKSQLEKCCLLFTRNNLHNVLLYFVGVQSALLWPFPILINAYWCSSFNNEKVCLCKTARFSCPGLTKQAFSLSNWRGCVAPLNYSTDLLHFWLCLGLDGHVEVWLQQSAQFIESQATHRVTEAAHIDMGKFFLHGGMPVTQIFMFKSWRIYFTILSLWIVFS